MSKTASYNSANSTTTTTVPDWDKLPCVQYGFPDGKGPTRAPKLCTIFEPIPDGATTASPVYVLTREQYERQQGLESGYEVKGATSIATELQNECENDNRVLYPVHIESDVYPEEGPATLIEWFREFVEDYLNVPFDTCTLYFSGNRSIHVHVPRFVSGEAQREQLKERAETFCEETGAELDCGLYYSKRLFRLPGVEHAKSELRKVEIEPEWGHSRIIRESNTSIPAVPESYEEILRRVFVRKSLTVDSAHSNPYTPHDLFRVLDGDKTVLEFSSEKAEIEIPLIEQKQYPDNSADVITWLQYNVKEFSPYALANGNGRSVAVVKVMGGAFARREIRNGATMVPAYFYGARGCAGEKFTKDHKHAPLQLSARDYEKWDYDEGDYVVIIGGQSRNSRIFSVESWDATVIGHALTGEGASRQAALDYLEQEGYDAGSAGRSGTNTSSSEQSGTSSQHGYASTAESPMTEAGELQRKAEQEGVETLGHHERFRVACRLLKRGWNPAWEWFEVHFGAGFKPQVTRKQFQSVITTYPEDYDHVEVPEKTT